jgi:hypothetical protein
MYTMGALSYIAYKRNTGDWVTNSNNGVGNKVTSNKGNTYNTKPSANHNTVTKNPGLKGEANSSVDIIGKDGKLATRRWFDENGNQIRDVDMTNHGNPGQHPEWPHEHGPR